MATPRFVRVVNGDVGPHCEGYGRALAKVTNKWSWWKAVPQKRKWGWWHKRAANAIKKKMGWPQDGVYDRKLHNYLKKFDGFDSRSIALINSYTPPEKPKVPDLGPIWGGGKSVLLHSLTHATSGLPLYPAFDDAFKSGTIIIAPETMKVTRHSGGEYSGYSVYATGVSGIRWYFTHLYSYGRAPVGATVPKGSKIGIVASTKDHPGARVPHVHCGLNVEWIWGRGKQLEHHTNYTYGAPLVGVQLAKVV